MSDGQTTTRDSARQVVAFDTETCLIKPALLAPPLVCITWQRPGLEPRIAVGSEAKLHVTEWLRDPTSLLIGQNVAYDMAVVGEEWPELLPLIFAAYDADRVADTQIRAQLLDIAAGTYGGTVDDKGRRTEYRYDLESLARRYAGLQIQKDAWRLSYGEFRGLPLNKWPARAREIQAAAQWKLAAIDPKDEDRAKEAEGLRLMIDGDPERCTTYPLDDARATLAVYQAQEVHAEYLEDQYRQARAAFALHLSSAWGLRTDAEGVKKLRAAVEAELRDVDEELQAIGLVRPDGTRDTKVAKRRMLEVCRRERLPVVRTDAHFKAGGKCKALDGSPLPDEHPDCAEHVSLDADACDRTDDDVLMNYAERTTLGKQISNDIPALERGITYPIHPRYGLAGTGRTTCSRGGKDGLGANIQNQSKRPGFRECFVPRPGWVFAQCDFPGLELYTWAQCCKTWFGFSDLADALNDGLDPHLALGAELLGISYDEAKANKKRPDVYLARRQSKPGNFGFAGGMGVPKFTKSTRKQIVAVEGRDAWQALGLDAEVEPGRTRAHVLKDAWMKRWRESRPHFERAGALTADGLGVVESLFTKRVRGGTTFCATCNTPFQGLGADCAKNAMWLIARAQYTQPHSLLYNTRTVAFVHDEFIIEVPDDARAHDAAYELARLMVEGANAFLPDVPIPRKKLEPLLMRRWSKTAEPTFDGDGRLVPYTA